MSELLSCPFCGEYGFAPIDLHRHFVKDWCPEYGAVLDEAEKLESPPKSGGEIAVPMGESRWLIERTYAKGQPAERREFWLGVTDAGSYEDAFYSNPRVWTADALQAARFATRDIAYSLRLRHFHPEAPIEACEHMFQCGIAPELPKPNSSQSCPEAEMMGEFACKDRTQCFEPCGDLGHSAEHARPSEDKLP